MVHTVMEIGLKRSVFCMPNRIIMFILRLSLWEDALSAYTRSSFARIICFSVKADFFVPQNKKEVMIWHRYE